MKISFNKIVVVAIDNQCIKRGKDMVMGYANNSFVGFMYWMHIFMEELRPET